MQSLSALLLITSICAAFAFESTDQIHTAATHFRRRSEISRVVSLLGFRIFQRQFCPNFSIPCSNGVCCSYSPLPTSCCGDTCCEFGSLCTGGTKSKPCCVAITDLTNTCGSENRNPCAVEGHLPCPSVAEHCCPPDKQCYVYSLNDVRCDPGNLDIPKGTPQSISLPIYPATTTKKPLTSISYLPPDPKPYTTLPTTDPITPVPPTSTTVIPLPISPSPTSTGKTSTLPIPEITIPPAPAPSGGTIVPPPAELPTPGGEPIIQPTPNSQGLVVTTSPQLPPSSVIGNEGLPGTVPVPGGRTPDASISGSRSNSGPSKISISEGSGSQSQTSSGTVASSSSAMPLNSSTTKLIDESAVNNMLWVGIVLFWNFWLGM